MLKKFGEDIWISSGTKLEIAGFGYETRMVVIRLSDGGLWVWSPVSLDPALKAAVDQLGPVRYIVSPNKFHYLFLPDCQAAYPDAKCFAAPGLENRRKEIPFDGTLQDGPAPEWAEDLDQAIFFGNVAFQEVVFHHRKSRTVIFCDLIQQFPDDQFAGWRRTIARLDCMVGDEPQVPRKFRLMTLNRRAARRALSRIKDWSGENILLAHGQPVVGNGAAILDRAFDWLT